jgi:hypothetical protein
MAEVCGQLLGEVDQRPVDPVQALQHNGVPVGEQPGQGDVVDLVSNAGPDPPGTGEPGRGQRPAGPGDPQERGAKPSPADQLIDGVQREQVVIRPGPVVGQRCVASPDAVGELVDRDADTPA